MASSGVKSSVVDLGVLRGELLGDPLSLGYSGNISTGDDSSNASLLDVARSSGFTVFRNDIQPREVVNIIAPGDFIAATQIQLSKLQILFQGAPIDATLPGVRTNFQNIFSGSATLLSGGLSSIAQRNGSRAEVLFGTSVSVTSTDVANALRHTSGGLPASGYPFTG